MGSFKFAKKQVGGLLGKIASPLDEKLKAVKWGEFMLENLFDSSNGDVDIQKKHINGKGTYVITSGVTNNGILGKTNLKSRIFKSRTITVDMFGSVFYRQFEYKMVTHARVFSLKPKFEIIDEHGLFISNSLKYLEKFFGYENMCSWEKIKKNKINLPITTNGKIDFDFMESFIRELEEEHVHELEEDCIRKLSAYLKVSGLDSYELTKDEEKALKDFEKGNFILKEFEYIEIFNRIEQGSRLKKDDQKKGTIPFVMSGVTNTGVVNYISNPISLFPANSLTVDIFGNTFYRSFSYGAGDDTGVYWNDEKKYTKEQMLFFAAAITKSLQGKFSYGHKLRSSQSLNLKMQLPVKFGEPDISCMETIISAIQKLVIKDVVLYADRKIAATKESIEKSSK